VLDVDWRDNTSFASCSGDHTVLLCKLGEQRPLKVFRGHKSDVNAVRWDPTGQVLASCSDDLTAKVRMASSWLERAGQGRELTALGGYGMVAVTQIWNLKSEGPVFDLKEHTQQIYTVKWNPAESLMLASYAMRVIGEV